MPSPLPGVFLLLAMAAVGHGQDSMPGCGSTCVTRVTTDRGAQLGCPDGALSCLCANPSFFFGIHDCAAALCAADLLPSVDNFATKLCASATAAVVPTAGPPTSTSLFPAITTTPPLAPTTTASLTSATVSPAGQTSSSITTAPVRPTAAASSSQPSSAAGTKSTSASGTASTAGANDVGSEASSGGLSNGAKIGVGIGAAAGGIALIALVACILITRRHKRKADRPGHYQISDPLPGSGRSYANDHHHKQYQPASKSELESKSRRYEDMVPRQKPRTMV